MLPAAAPFLSLAFSGYLAVAGAYEKVNVNVSQPESSAPLDLELAYYKLPGYNGDKEYLTHSFIQTDCGSNMSIHHTDPHVWGDQTGTPEKPILILTHGYPESSYIWRDVIPDVSKRVPIVCPDQPGYGLSSPCCNVTGCFYDKRTYSRAILQAVEKIYGNSSVIYGGHDRGGRTMHRAALDNNYPGITGLGLWMADIVPFVEEYRSFQNPLWAQNYFHWAFLPKGKFATDVIMAYGGGNWVRQILEYGSGMNKKAISVFKRGKSWEIYENFFNQLSVTNASVFDYQDGAFIDFKEQLWDQDNGTKVSIPTHVMYSIYNLGSEFDVYKVWSNWTDPSAAVTVKGVGDNRGHFIIEEAPEDAVEQLCDFMDRLGVDNSTRGGK